MAKGGGSNTVQRSEVSQSNLPEYARPYFEGMMQRAQGTLNRPYIPFGYTQNPTTGAVERAVDPTTGQPVSAQRIADFTPEQQAVQREAAGLRGPTEFNTSQGLATAAGLGALSAGQYGPGQFRAQQIGMPQLRDLGMGGPELVQAGQFTAPQMGTAQTGFRPDVQAFQMGGVRDVGAQGVYAPTMEAARTAYGEQPLEQFRMAAPQQFGVREAQQYMSPFISAALEPQMREAITSARRGQVAQDLGAARQGTYGGSRQLLAAMERERNLGQQLGDIQARGMQSAFESAQAQFERDRAAGMTAGQQNLEAALRQQQLGTQTGLQAAMANLSNEQQARVNNQAMQFQAQGMNAEQAMRAALANQGVDVTRGQANLQAQMQAQQLGTQTGAQLALANLDAASQANVQNLAAQLQTQGLSADQALRAALANQQAQITTGQQNLQAALETQRLGAQTGLEALRANQQADLERQRMREQSRQFGAQQALAGFGQAGQTAQTLANLGAVRQQSDLSRLGFQQQTAAQNQALQQQYLDMAYQDFLRQRDYPLEMLQQYSSLLRGVPVTPSTTTTTYAPSPGIAQQLMGTGLGAASIYNAFRGGA
jgi:hypothetical protein